MLELEPGVSAADFSSFLTTPMIFMAVAFAILFTVKKLKPDFKPRVSMPVFVVIIILGILTMLAVLSQQIVIHGFQ